MILLYIIIWVVALFIQYFIAKQFESVAADKGYQGSRFFHLSFWLGLPGWLLVISLPDRGKHSSYENNTSSEPTKDSTPVVSNTPDPLISPLPTESNKGTAVPPKSAVDGEIICPSCGTKQLANRKLCWNCGQKFSAQ